MPSCPTELSRGGLPVEEVKAQVALNEKRSGSVGDYDPVLRAHCRLDREGLGMIYIILCDNNTDGLVSQCRTI
jgi:hypothetical protein